jgi:hypothetical protein
MKKITILMMMIITTNVIMSQTSVKRSISLDTLGNFKSVMRWRSDPLFIKSPLLGNDTIVFGILSDSISENVMTLILYGFFPTNINTSNTSVRLIYSDKSYDDFIQIGYTPESNYCAYGLEKGDLLPILNKKVMTIVINGVVKYDVKDKTFFKDFLSLIMR